jgi:hypothetical protein
MFSRQVQSGLRMIEARPIDHHGSHVPTKMFFVAGGATL